MPFADLNSIARVIATKRHAAIVAAALVALSLWSRVAGAQKAAALSPTMTATSPLSPDSLYAAVVRRLTAREYRIDSADASSRRLVVRAPRDEATVQIGITARGDSSLLSIAAIGTNMMFAMGSSVSVMFDATVDPKSESHPRDPAASP